jgi:D-methionine transport system substrate-binding protein
MRTAIIAALALLYTLQACTGKPDKKDPNHIVIGTAAGPESRMAEMAKKVAKEKYNLDVEIVTFNDYVMPNEALRQKDLDANAFQNKPYLDVQSRERGYNFAIMGNTFVYPLAGYSKKITHISQLKDGATIIIPNDPTNGGRSLLLLQQVGLIRLKDSVGFLPTVNDIVSNPKQIKILQMEAPQLTRALDDQHVAVAIINGNFSASIGLTATHDGIFMEDSSSPYVNIIVARAEDRNDDRIVRFVKAYQSPEVEQVAIKEFKGGAIKGW